MRNEHITDKTNKDQKTLGGNMLRDQLNAAIIARRPAVDGND